ncbi:hypothetical protein L228DRAFT_268511 [Xylona heveae TC161]|uniref:Uncharacterized protein n=1 Tax=Xylona heveae (strain CBS 132557 / TC161) TaxID=1328760 RepID=A0A165GC35_XYLHT|nr:hypothetical protein L228DRAFT_268511 [Xylona heveae TC161]KZF22011.1 hypothetical protein L228DRAFT_268511 [Xylona heveae TC161]
MVLGLLTIAAIPTTIGVCEGVAQQREQNKQDEQESRLDKFHLDVFCDARSNRAKEIHGRHLVLKNGKVYVASRGGGRSKRQNNENNENEASSANKNTSLAIRSRNGTQTNASDSQGQSQSQSQNQKQSQSQGKSQDQGQGKGQGQGPTLHDLSQAHPVTAFYIVYPDEERPPPRPRGLVSTISDDPPMLNWLYADKDTMEIKYGNRTQSREHIVGPWDWTEDEVGLTLEGWEGFVAVEEEVKVNNGGKGNGDGDRDKDKDEDEEADAGDERESLWAIYFDRKDDRLRSLGGTRRKVLEISLERRMVEEDKQGREGK